MFCGMFSQGPTVARGKYVLSLNTAGVGDNFKRRKIFNCLKKSCSSKGIVLLQNSPSSRDS